jgi:hypothetical protein
MLLLILILISCNIEKKHEALEVFVNLTGVHLLDASQIKRYSSTYPSDKNLFSFLGAGATDGSFFIEADISKDLLNRIEKNHIQGFSEVKNGPITDFFLLYVDFGYKNTGYGKGDLYGDKKLIDLIESDMITYRVKLLNSKGNNGELITYDHRYNKLWYTKWDS